MRAAILSTAFPLAALAADPLHKAFRDPTREYSMEPFWPWNSTLVPERLRWQIDQMLDKGIFGAYMHARAGLDESATPYFSEGFWEAVRVSVEHGAKRGFRTWIYDEDKWPSGAAGGRTIAANPARFRAMGLQHRSQTVRGPARHPIRFPEAMFVLAARQAGPGRIASDSLTDLTELNRSAGVWDVPSGDWVISMLEPVRGREDLPHYLNPDTVGEFIRNTC